MSICDLKSMTIAEDYKKTFKFNSTIDEILYKLYLFSGNLVCTYI